MAKPTPPDMHAIAAARERIAPYIRKTPVIRIAANELGTHPPFDMKLECLQHGGSFKTRGAFNTLLSRDVPPGGVAAASGGNHGIAVALAANRLGFSARIFVPEISSPAKIAKLRATGCEIVVKGDRYADALAECEAHMATSGAMGIHAYDAPETLAGQGTLALEWSDQSGPLDTLVVAVGGGGLIGGIGAAYGGQMRLVAVETEGTPTYHRARLTGAPTDVDVSGIAADSLGARQIGSLPFAVLSGRDVPSVLVSDHSVREAQKILWARLRIVAEPGGAAALAALLSGHISQTPGERIGILVCGANTDPGELVA